MLFCLDRARFGVTVTIFAFALGGIEAASAAGWPSAGLPHAASAWDSLRELVSSTYDRAPALVLGLAALLTLPPLALIGLAFRRAPVAEVIEATQVYRRSGRSRRAPEPVPEEEPLWPSDAWIEFASGDRRAIGSILRIGRDADNDVCLDDKTVHRYHAAIHCTDDAAYVVTDLSSAGGNGVVVNGHRIVEERLSDGDTIELGQIKLKFISRPA